jgi:hypothetical protein
MKFSHIPWLKLVTSIALCIGLGSCAAPPVSLGPNECTIRAKVGSLIGGVHPVVWIVDDKPKKVFGRPVALSAGSRRLGVVTSPLPGWQSYAVMPVELGVGKNYELSATCNILTIPKSSVTYRLVDKSTGVVVAEMQGVNVPGRGGEFLSSDKGAGLEALEDAMGIEVPVDWPTLY